ncbi:MAG: SUMF1/EgtB/PvdO family nonheme iron enzyme [Anaerolineales bacterium]|nr:SUMF1/EgtB/PvdO family nonheme iron enzyme [Anaerolineales bacterium]
MEDRRLVVKDENERRDLAIASAELAERGLELLTQLFSTLAQKPPLVLTLAPGVTMEFVHVPAGRFLMGSTPEQVQRAIHEMGRGSWLEPEQPQHTGELSEYWMGKYPVTNQQYQAFVQAAGRTPPKHWEGGKIPSGKEQHPVVYVSWHDALAFCQWASQAAGQPIRLPTEAEWEKAARGTDGRTFPWGEALPDEKRCNFNDNIKDTTPVGQHSPQGDSPYGCADMAGNVREWCADWFDEGEYARRGQTIVRDPQGPHRGEHRALRGGSYSSYASNARCASRDKSGPNLGYDHHGFRVAVSSHNIPRRQVVEFEPMKAPAQPVRLGPAVLPASNKLVVSLAPGVTITFVRVPAERFLMGTSPEQVQRAVREMGAQEDWLKNEQPQHTVELSEYWIGRYPVTNQQYLAFVQATRKTAPEHWRGEKTPAGKEQHPVVNVSWYDAREFCQWASRATGQEVCLPSEAEWEKAARGTDGRTFPWGEELPDELRGNFSMEVGDTTPVGRYSPQGDSPYGCADMAGNVYEWTSSLFIGYRHQANDGRESLKIADSRMVRGSPFNYSGRFARCASRGLPLSLGFKNGNVGFRVVARPLPLGSEASGLWGNESLYP